MRRHCSLPEFGNLRKWFEKNFNQACAYHDRLYARRAMSRYDIDRELVRHMIKAIDKKSTGAKILIYWPVIALTFIGVRAFGWTRY